MCIRDNRDTDGASLIRNGAGDGLTDPPGCVGGELEAPLRLKLFRCLHQAEVALLNKIQKRQSTPGVALGYRHHQPQVRFAQGAARLCIPGPGSLCQRHLLSGGQQRHPADLDVYKRQGVDLIIDQVMQLEVVHITNGYAVIEPVSYTHLDVYKRQLP